jgi:hypothetical protein
MPLQQKKMLNNGQSNQTLLCCCLLLPISVYHTLCITYIVALSLTEQVIHPSIHRSSLYHFILLTKVPTNIIVLVVIYLTVLI